MNPHQLNGCSLLVRWLPKSPRNTFKCCLLRQNSAQSDHVARIYWRIHITGSDEMEIEGDIHLGSHAAMLIGFSQSVMTDKHVDAPAVERKVCGS